MDAIFYANWGAWYCEPMPPNSRLDLLLVDRGLLPTRQAAQAAIMDGGVLVDGKKITKPGTAIKLTATIELTANWKGNKYVSRGGFKLERALECFSIDVTGATCIDLGASTGGFTDCLLKSGAAKVFAIDVGFGQLIGSLRQDSRVVVKERVNARFLTPELLYGADEQPATFAVADLSFISIAKVLPACIDLLSEDGEVVALIKPQFEAGKTAVGKGGVVREKSTHISVLRDAISAAAELGLSLRGLTYSPLKGPAGNIEFLAYWKLKSLEIPLDVEEIVSKAHADLNTAPSSSEE